MTTMRVPFGTVAVSERSRRLVAEALESAQVSSGKLVRQFEERFAELVGVGHAVAVSSGTDADILALAALYDFGARRGEEVIVPALSFVATGNAVVHAGFKPVFVDIKPDTFNIDVDLIEAAITERTRAIIPVHLMGKPADMDRINAIAKNRGLFVVEDAAEAHGAFYRGKPVGGLADMAAFSTYVAHIVTTGEGGVVTTNGTEHAEVLRSLRAHGRACTCELCVMSTGSERCSKRFSGPGGEDVRFLFPRLGYSAKMNELEAALGLGNLDDYDAIVSRRRGNLLYLLERFGDFAPYLATFREEEHEIIGPHALPIVVGPEASFTREQLTAYLEDRGIETRTLFASIPTQYPSFAFLGRRLGEFPEAEHIGRNGIHIGVHQGLGIEEMEYVLDAIKDFLETHQR